MSVKLQIIRFTTEFDLSQRFENQRATELNIAAYDTLQLPSRNLPFARGLYFILQNAVHLTICRRI